jgi:hypothetical protein
MTNPEWRKATSQKHALQRSGLVNVLIMSTGFFFIMGGYSPVQSFASSLLEFKCLPLGYVVCSGDCADPITH